MIVQASPSLQPGYQPLPEDIALMAAGRVIQDCRFKLNKRIRNDILAAALEEAGRYRGIPGITDRHLETRVHARCRIALAEVLSRRKRKKKRVDAIPRDDVEKRPFGVMEVSQRLV